MFLEISKVNIILLASNKKIGKFEYYVMTLTTTRHTIPKEMGMVATLMLRVGLKQKQAYLFSRLIFLKELKTGLKVILCQKIN